METLINLFSSLSKPQNTPSTQEETKNYVPKEILDQYPYGEFPIQYTKPGQETIRKNSENRFSYNDEYYNKDTENNYTNNKQSSFDISSLLPLIQILSNKKNSQQDMMQVFSKILFKDNPELEKLMNLFSKQNKEPITHQEINNTSNFPNTNKICIANLKKIND